MFWCCYQIVYFTLNIEFVASVNTQSQIVKFF
jgi:hypothetical protein